LFTQLATRLFIIWFIFVLSDAALQRSVEADLEQLEQATDQEQVNILKKLGISRQQE
jgi:hypothetical protein